MQKYSESRKERKRASDIQDLNVVRSTLHLDAASEEEALRAFRADFNESLRNAWTISLDWWFHMMNQRRNSAVGPIP